MSQDRSRRAAPDAASAGASSTDAILDQWRRERPDLDPSPMAVCGDVWRASERLRQAVLANAARYDLDFPGLDVVLSLRRQGRGAALSPSALAKEMMLSSSAMTNRLDRLEKRGLVRRAADPNDRRAIRILLTDAGFDLSDAIVAPHLAAEARMLDALTAAERAELRRLLTKIGEA